MRRSCSQQCYGKTRCALESHAKLQTLRSPIQVPLHLFTSGNSGHENLDIMQDKALIRGIWDGMQRSVGHKNITTMRSRNRSTRCTVHRKEKGHLSIPASLLLFLCGIQLLLCASGLALCHVSSIPSQEEWTPFFLCPRRCLPMSTLMLTLDAGKVGECKESPRAPPTVLGVMWRMVWCGVRFEPERNLIQ